MTGPSSPASRVAWAGAQRNVLAGDLRATISLDELRGLDHWYGLGPVEGLVGEISVFDGVPLLARVVENEVVVEESRHARACFLVYAQVARWHRTTVATALDGNDLASQLESAVARHGLGDGAPYPFLLRGVASTLVFHVLDKRDGLPHSPERHEHAKVRFTLHDHEVEVIGFHSSTHRGIFTPGDANVHMHFRTADSKASGHVEQVSLKPGWTIGLPAIESSTPRPKQ